MEANSTIYQTYVKILARELVPAMGCTEPIALAYCAAKARSVLGKLPDRIRVEASGNIIKNVKSVVVPNTGGRSGIAAAVAIGVLGGDENARLQVISKVTPETIEKLGPYISETAIEISLLESESLLDMIVTVFAGDSCAKVRIANEHTNIILIEKDGEVLFAKDPVSDDADKEDVPDYSLLTVKDIYDFATTCNLTDVAPILERQIRLNTAISDEGLRHNYGANIGKVPAVSFQVVVEAGEARFFQLVELFPVQEPCRKADGKLRLLFEPADGFGNLFHVPVRERSARGDDGVTGDACGLFLLGVVHDFVGAEELVFGSSRVVVAALGAVLAVFGTATTSGVHDGTEVEVVTVKLFADFVGGIAEFLEVFA